MRTKVVAILALVPVTIVGILVMAAIINGTPGDDTLTDTPANDVIRGFAGDDNITSNFKNDRIDGGEDDDQILITSPGRAYVVGGPGNDVIVSAQSGSFSVQRLFGNDGDDNIVVEMSPHGSRIEGGDGDDVIDVNNVSGNNVIYGGDGDDEIEAINSAGNNKVYGGPGQDNITLGSGSNFVEPGEDADVVVAGTAVQAATSSTFALATCLQGRPRRSPALLLILQQRSSSSVARWGSSRVRHRPALTPVVS
jgi:Ca2+-binding RTX toxin-like protein